MSKTKIWSNDYKKICFELMVGSYALYAKALKNPLNPFFESLLLYCSHLREEIN